MRIILPYGAPTVKDIIHSKLVIYVIDYYT